MFVFSAAKLSLMSRKSDRVSLLFFFNVAMQHCCRLLHVCMHVCMYVCMYIVTPRFLYATFASPWAEEPATPEPQFTLPSWYYLQPPPLKPMHLKNFQLETLFYIFYSMPQDVLQASCGQKNTICRVVL